MNVRRPMLFAMLAASLLALAAACGSDDPTATPTTGAATVNVTLAEWSVAASPASANAGSVTFAAKNNGLQEHELVIVKTDLAPDALTVVSGKVDEAASGVLIGEIEPDELQAGQSASASFALTAGKYVLICNITGHYGLGMRTGFTVN